MNETSPSNADFWKAMLTAVVIELACFMLVYWFTK